MLTNETNDKIRQNQSRIIDNFNDIIKTQYAIIDDLEDTKKQQGETIEKQKEEIARLNEQIKYLRAGQ